VVRNVRNSRKKARKERRSERKEVEGIICVGCAVWALASTSGQGQVYVHMAVSLSSKPRHREE